jgi:hypothetical protein
MELLIGVLLALGVGLFGTFVGLDRERGFYPVMMIVIAAYYGLFAIMSDGSALAVEVAIMAPFVVAAVIGFRRNLWLVVGALIGHGLMDLVHPRFIDNAGAPGWWPMFCLSFDVVAGLFLAVRLLRAAPVRAA